MGEGRGPAQAGAPTGPSPAAAACRSEVRAALLALGLLAMGCAPPRQAGEVVVASGASERLALAWRFGYAGAEGPVAPATVRVLASTADLPASAGARVGDVVLDNGEVSFVVAAADGTLRGGTLIDAWSTGRPDELGSLRVLASDRPVLALSVRTGTDAPTRTAWVDVVGTVDTPTGPLEVVTRYDVAPGVRGVLVHSTLRVPARGEDLALAIGDAIEPRAGEEVGLVSPALGAPALLAQRGEQGGYAIVGLGAATDVDLTRRTQGRLAFSIREAPGELLTFSRFVAVLDRPDSLALRVVQARSAGIGVGELELTGVDVRGLPAPLRARAELILEETSGLEEPVFLSLPLELAPGGAVIAEVPAGSWTVRLAHAGFEPTAVEVAASRLSRARVRVTQRSALSPEVPLGLPLGPEARDP